MQKILIDTPPPTISGELHIGHIYSYCHIDFIARYFRNRHLISGEKACVEFPIGFDNNGSPTFKLMQKTELPSFSCETISFFSQEYMMEYLRIFSLFGINFDREKSPYQTNKFGNLANTIFKFFFFKKKDLFYVAKKNRYFDSKTKQNIPEHDVMNFLGKLINKKTSNSVSIKKEKEFFIKTTSIKNELLKRIETIEFHPKKSKKVLVDWIENLNEDWSIVRKTPYGVSNTCLKERNIYKYNTWFCSALTTTYLEYHHKRKNAIIIRPQGADIICTWLFYSIVLDYLIRPEKKCIFDHVVISGWVIADDREKMSKSIGNIIKPEEILKSFSANEVRYWSAKGGLGTNTVYSEDVFKIGRRLLIKLENANKFFSINIPTENNYIHENFILKAKEKYQEMENKFNDYFEKEMDFSKALDVLERFFFDEFCSQYIEYCKTAKDVKLHNYLKQMLGKMNIMFNIFFK